jgi:hypothetical protein
MVEQKEARDKKGSRGTETVGANVGVEPQPRGQAVTDDWRVDLDSQVDIFRSMEVGGEIAYENR